jgi:hypothetical protein
MLRKLSAEVMGTGLIWRVCLETADSNSSILAEVETKRSAPWFVTLEGKANLEKSQKLDYSAFARKVRGRKWNCGLTGKCGWADCLL